MIVLAFNNYHSSKKNDNIYNIDWSYFFADDTLVAIKGLFPLAQRDSLSLLSHGI